MRHWLKGSGVGVRIAAKMNDPSRAHLRYRLRKGASTHPSFAMRVIASGTTNCQTSNRRYGVTATRAKSPATLTFCHNASAGARKTNGTVGRSVGTQDRELGINMFWRGMRSHLTNMSA